VAEGGRLAEGGGGPELPQAVRKRKSGRSMKHRRGFRLQSLYTMVSLGVGAVRGFRGSVSYLLAESTKLPMPDHIEIEALTFGILIVGY
jgi:hypothetical protein